MLCRRLYLMSAASRQSLFRGHGPSRSSLYATRSMTRRTLLQRFASASCDTASARRSSDSSSGPWSAVIRQQLRQSVPDALDRAFPPGSHGMPVVRTTTKTPPHFSYLVDIDQSKLPPPGSGAMRRPPRFCLSYSSSIASIVSPFSLSFGL